ncbi:hypothetical protein LSH36_134g04011 [Paralvinella palmiformis]|uniref:Rab-GAP TBC domain-containing protein n=1 Tax=Paralvinella palmiformis TaxID=53620 RepID=A0AAD9JXA3_9ANNE|nr:hypothetical protein LSH36_134g04011 [Paralvinella palmiformis]
MKFQSIDARYIHGACLALQKTAQTNIENVLTDEQMNHEQKELLARSARERADIVRKYEQGHTEGADIDPWEDPAFEVYHVTDRYGFIHDHPLPEVPDSVEAKAQQVELQRTKKWVKMIRKWDKYYPGEKLTRRVQKGIPERLRGDVWCRLLDVYKLKQEQKGVYEEMKERAHRFSPDIRQIDLDVNRTYRNHIMFRKRYDVKQQHLFHVLAAYSMYNTEVGYCQGMSQIAALLLMYMDEEEAFWALSALLTNLRHGMHGFFIPGFPKLLRFQEHHDRILNKFLKKVRKHLEKNDIYTSLYTIKWFLQCFLDRVPFPLTLRLWDSYMLLGERVLVGMSYNLLKMHKRRILKMQMDDLINFFQSDLEKDFMYSDDQVIDSLQLAMDELKKAKMDTPPKGDVNELPTKPFGLFVPPTVEQLIGRQTMDLETDLISDKQASGQEIRPSIPADGGRESLPLGMARHLSLDEGLDAMTDGMSSIADYGSSRTSFMDQSDVASTVTTMSRPSFNTLSDADIYYRHMGYGENALRDGNEKNSPSQSQASEYDNLNSSMYEQDLERTLEGMDFDGNATFKRGMTLLDYNGLEDLTSQLVHMEPPSQIARHFDRMSRSSESSDLTQQATRSPAHSARLSESADLTPRVLEDASNIESAFHFGDVKYSKSYEHKHYEYQQTNQVMQKVTQPGSSRFIQLHRQVGTKTNRSQSPTTPSTSQAHNITSAFNGYQETSSSLEVGKSSSHSKSRAKKKPSPSPSSEVVRL